MSELERIPGTGKDDRVTKSDILNYLQNRGNVTTQQTVQVEKPVTQAPVVQEKSSPVVQSVSSNGNNEIVEMDRMRKLIADHMVMSKKLRHM